MLPDSTTSSSPAPQAPAPQAAAPGPQLTAPANPASASSAAPSPASGPQPAPASPAPQPTPVQLLWEVAHLAFGLMTRLVHVLRPIQQYYPKQALLLARVLIDIPRIILTIRFAPEHVTLAQLRHLTRARHILQALFNYTLPTLSPNSPSATNLGPRTSSSATATVHQHPSASPENTTPLGARTPSSANATANQYPSPSPNPPSSTTPGTRKPSSATSATPTIRQVPEIPMVAGVSQVPASPTVDHNPLTPDPSHSSPTSHPSHSAFPDPQSANPHSAFSPFIPDVHTLLQALKSSTLPPNCAGALFENPGEALVKALHQLHTIYFSLYPNQPPTQSPSPSPSQSSVNLQSGTSQSDAPSVNPINPVNSVHSVHNVHSVHPASPTQSEISNLKSEIPNPQSSICNLQSGTPHSDAPSVHPVNPVNTVNPVHSVHSPSPAQSAIHNPQSNAPP